MNKIIAIVGMCGSGKSVVVDYFTKNNYKKVYFGGITLEKMQEEGIEITPENEKLMREGLRAKYGMAAYAILSLPKIREYFSEGNVIIDGLYSWDELITLQEEFGSNIKVIAVVVDKKVRYNRLRDREIRPLNIEEATKRDISEIENIAKGGPIAYADYYVFNNGDVEDLNNRLDAITSDINEDISHNRIK